jgi:hypothetical protein
MLWKNEVGEIYISKYPIFSIQKNYNIAKIFLAAKNLFSQTQGVDYYLDPDDSKKIDYVFLDCEGSDNYNEGSILKEYLAVCSISNIIIFNVQKAAEDHNLVTIYTKLLTQMEILKMPIPEIYVLVRDTGKTVN